MALVALDLGHVGRTGGRAAASIDGVREDLIVVRYAMIAAGMIMAAGHEVAILGHDRYRDRALWAARNSDVYVACHANAGAGTYGLVLHDHRSRYGRDCADQIAGELEMEWPGVLSGARVVAARESDSDGYDHWTAAAFSLISPVYPGRPCGVVYEPGFIDQIHHAEMWTNDGLDRIGRALARGVLAFLEGR